MGVTGKVEEAGAEAVAEYFILVIEFNLIQGVLVLVDLLLELGERLVQLLSLLEEFGELVDLELILLGHLHVCAVYLAHLLTIDL